MKSFTRKSLVLACLLSIIAGAGAALAVTFILGISNPVTVTVNDIETTIVPTLTVDKTSILTGESIVLSVDATSNWANQNINFYEDGALIKTVVTDGEGKAEITHTPTIGIHAYKAGQLP